MPQFEVLGPFSVPLDQGVLYKEAVDNDFWPKHRELANRLGCYVFCVNVKRSSRLQILYVGKSTKGFGGETFHSEKISKLNDYLRHHPSAKLSLFLVGLMRGKGPSPVKAIEQLEEFLIDLAKDASNVLLNKKGTKAQTWGIKGIVRGGKGKPSTASKRLRDLLGLGGEANGTKRKPAKKAEGEEATSVKSPADAPSG